MAATAKLGPEGHGTPSTLDYIADNCLRHDPDLTREIIGHAAAKLGKPLWFQLGFVPRSHGPEFSPPFGVEKPRNTKSEADQ